MKKIIGFLAFFMVLQALSQDTIMSIEEYSPISSLKVSGEKIYKAKFPFVDVHSHHWNMPEKDLKSLVKEMDDLNMAFLINLSGSGFGTQKEKETYFENSKKNIEINAPGRFGLFVNVDFESIDEDDYAKTQVEVIRNSAKNGAIGLKIYKSLGLRYKDKHGNRIPINDARLDPIWAVCGELNIPVLIHSADPFQFWLPKDIYNERWLELKEKPNRYYAESNFVPPFEQLLTEQHDVFRKHPSTIFINAHMGWMANDLARMSRHLDKFPNVMVEFGAVIAEFGRQPKTARQFFIDYQDRILFGKDLYKKEEYYTYFRVLESNDEYFDYFRKRHAFWKMYGLNLPDPVLKKIYYKNALKLFPTISKALFK